MTVSSVSLRSLPVLQVLGIMLFNGTAQKREMKFFMKKVILKFDITSTGYLGLLFVRETLMTNQGFYFGSHANLMHP